MASDLRIRIGGATATITLNGANGEFTDQQVADVLRRYARSLGIAIDGTAQENLTAILEHIRDDVRRRARGAQAREAKATSDAAIEAQAETDNAI